MIENKLEILIITYNRSKDLENTFKELIKSPFANCKITVLDNCSKDETPNICIKYQKLFHEMYIIRHEKNIGASPNYLRAVEVSRSLYTWILCDDDHYDFSNCLDVISAVESEEFDLITVGDPGYCNLKRGIKTTSKRLIYNTNGYFYNLGFVPSLIFKTKLYDSYCIHKGYLNAHNFYPHFVFINKSVEENFSVYVSKKIVVIRGEHNSTGTFGLKLYIGWINSCLMIKDDALRRNTIYEVFLGSSLIKSIITLIVLEKIRNDKDLPNNGLSLVWGIFLAFKGSKDIFSLLVIIPTLLIPSILYKTVIKIFLLVKYGKSNYGEKREELTLDENFGGFRI